MPKTTKPSYGKRESMTHRVLYYLHTRTSPKHPEWRNETIRFFYELFKLTHENKAINLLFLRADGLRIYLGYSKPVVYIQFYQKHFLIHAYEEYKIWSKGDSLFQTRHDGSWPRMWKATTAEEVTKLLNYLSALPRDIMDYSGQASRTIPKRVKELVFERDKGQCQHILPNGKRCLRTTDLCFDHILPFSKGGASDTPKNIQLLCSQHNSEKRDNF